LVPALESSYKLIFFDTNLSMKSDTKGHKEKESAKVNSENTSMAKQSLAD
jgi:hypothetical protein